MALAPITSTADQPINTKSLGSLAKNFDQFLLLLTTQLQHQDPLSPMDTNEFTQQLVSFAGVEQAIATNKNLESLIAMERSSQAVAALGYIGKTVEASSDQLPLINASGTFSYTLNGTAASVAYTIADASGRVVQTGTLDATAGRHEFTWDGRDLNGAQLADGAYQVTVAAIDTGGNPLEVPTTVIGKVTAIEMGDAGVILSLGKAKVPASALLAIIDRA